MKKLYRFFILTILSFSIFASILGYQYYTFLESPLNVALIRPMGTHNPHPALRATLSRETGEGKEGIIFVIPKGTPVYKIANDLAKAGIIKSSVLFLLAVYVNDSWHQLKAGEYLIKSDMTPIDLIHQLREAKVIQYALTIVPGWTFQRLIQEIQASSKIQHLLTGLSPAEIMAKLGHATEHPEGRFFPETYYYSADTTDIALLQRAYRDLDTALSQLWNTKKTDSILKTSYEALILASIIEKESSVSDEYRKISGVYTRRLAKNMPLQADPTVIYGANSSYQDKNITHEMLAHQNVYNTYLKRGLPPTPIALPSKKAIEAALDPEAGETLYFVAKPNGQGHIFTKNLADHNAAVAAYRQGIVNNTESAP